MEPVAELPDAEEESVALVDTKVLEEEEKLREQRKKEEDANQPTVRAPAPRLFRPIPPRVGRGHVAGAGAHPVSVPTTPRATFATSPAPLARTSTSARVTMRAIARARAVDDARAPRARPPPRSPHPQIAELFKARQVARPRLDSWILKSARA